jgi:signal transduction histidine kinase
MSAQDPSTKITLQVDRRTRHDLRTPLNQIIGYSEMLEEEANSTNQANLLPDLQKLNQAAHKMLQLVDDLFITENADTPQCAPVTDDEGALAIQQESDNAKSILTGRILVVDDNELNRDMLSRRLQRQGHQTELAENGRQALEFLRDEPFDLVLLDVMMPEMDGYAVLARMKEEASLRNIPIIMISALTEMDSVVKCIEMGAEDYLPKPFNPTLLRARVSASLEKKRFREQEQTYREQALKDQATMERHRSLAQMVVGVAHEINTPLGIACTALSIIDKRLSSSQIAELFKKNNDDKEILVDILEATALLKNNVIRANKLVENFKKISVSQITETKEIIDLPTLIADTLELFKINARQANLDVKIDTSTITGKKEWQGYAGYFTQVIMNLLQNIERYAYASGQGGKVNIAVTDSNDQQFMITVRDYGKGISSENIGKVFDPFFTTGRGKGGSGLGLAIVHNIVTTALQGSIEVSSEINKGTIFRITIPKIIME